MNHFTTTIDNEGIAWLTLDQQGSRINTLSREVLAELGQALEKIRQHPGLAGLVIQSGKPDGFIAGADITEFDDFKNEDVLRQALTAAHALFNQLADYPVPTVASIDGFCLGGGLELAMACQYRVATTNARLGFPEVKLGIFPGFGGTGRSIALSGPIKAMTAMLSGRNYKAGAAKSLGWLDRIVSTPDRLSWAARKLILGQRKKRQARLSDRLLRLAPARKLLASQMRRQTRRKANPEHYPAPFALIDLFEQQGGSTQTMCAGEINAFPPLMLSRTSESLRGVFMASEQLKHREPDFNPQRVHVIGAGVMGGDIAAWAALSGFEVTLQDLSDNAIKPALQRAKALFKKRLRTQPAIDNAMARLIPDVAGQGVARADIIIEAVLERLDVKAPLFATLEQQAKPEALLATNTSSLPLEQIAQNMRQPSRLVGVHFFNPVAQLPLVEVIRGENTDALQIRRAQSFVTSIKKYPLVVKSSPGFLVNRVLAPYMMDALARLEEGVPAEQLDAAAVSFGMPMGPIELMDTVGLDVCQAVAEELNLSDKKDTQLHRLIEQGHLGRKAGQGFYTWPLKRQLAPGDVELGKAMLQPLVQACEQCLAQGLVENERQLDVGVIFGTGFAPFLGGPLRARALGVL